MRLYKLKFHSALHVDSKGSGAPETADEFIRSDTLSAALCLSWSTLWPEDAPAIFASPPFRVSSAFPYLGDILLFPAPVWRVWKEVNVRKRKEMKSIKWISQGILEKILQGNLLDPEKDGVFRKWPGGVIVTPEEASRNPEYEYAQGWKMSERQRVGVDRLLIPHTGNLFFFAMQFFAEGAGLWFAAEGKDLSQFRPSLDFLGDSGIGADRNSGLGHFRVEKESEFSPVVPEGKGWMTLSLYNPSGPEDLRRVSTRCAYGFTMRSGWVGQSGIARPAVRAFTEASFFPVKPEGRMISLFSEQEREQLKLDHPVFRDFRPLCLPCVPPPLLEKESAP